MDCSNIAEAAQIKCSGFKNPGECPYDGQYHENDPVCSDCCYEAEAAMSGITDPWRWIQCVQEIDFEKSKVDLIAAGWDGPGWYFWDEIQAHCHGPFATRNEARQAMVVYVAELNLEK